MTLLRALRPYRKAIVAGILAAVVVAGQYYDAPLVQIAAAFASPIAVFLAKNEAD